MIKDLADNFGVFDGSQDPHPALAFLANADVDVEHPFEESRPGHPFWFCLGLLIWLDQLELRS